MISLSEPQDLKSSLEPSALDRTSVTRLVFELIQEPGEGVEQQVINEPTSSASDAIGNLEAKLCAQEEAFAQQLAVARTEALAETRREFEEELDRRLSEERSTLARVCNRFTQERTRYFAAVEEQVVRLSLAIAARVLHREAKMDPLLLMGAARVALEKIHDDSETVLRVSGDDLSMWMNQFGDGTTARSFRIVPDERMERGDCVLETSVGTVELGVEVQLAEIERGFFDLLQKRPA